MVSNSASVSRYADAIFFMSLLNSRDICFITSNPFMGAPVVYKSGIEPIQIIIKRTKVANLFKS
ncbi:geranylgeranylglyceryl/heptaprenylglyceryl phosphate synthase [Methanolobus halotolerans]|uniref:geranylgeranylglyceryl/heptaprenylglyceryl phosphate synthase n=1 Tax=Methanolobus halotolerans TaxID=2052935 RepID=UPI002E25B09D